MWIRSGKLGLTFTLAACICGCSIRSAGHPRPQQVPRGVLSSVAVGPKGDSIAFSTWSGDGSQMWLLREGARPQECTNGTYHDLRSLSWSPDGSRLAAVAQRMPEGPYAVVFLSIGSGEWQELAKSGPGISYLSVRWDPHEDYLAHVEMRTGGRFRIMLSPARDMAPTKCLIEATYGDIWPLSAAWSADGQSVYYYSPRRHAFIVTDRDSADTRAWVIPEGADTTARLYPSPCGRYVLGLVQDTGADESRVYLVRTSEGSATLLGVAGGKSAAWSPDSEQVALEASPPGTGLNVVDVGSGKIVALTRDGVRDELAGGEAWTRRGRIIFVRQRRRLMRIDATGGEAVTLFAIPQ